MFLCIFLLFLRLKKIFISAVIFLFSSFAFSQSADFVSNILESPQVTFGQIGYLVAVYQNFVPESATEDEAMASLFNAGQIQGVIDSSKIIRYDEAAFLFSKIWKINGGLFFRLTKANPRYAFRQLRADGVIPKNADPSNSPSGVQILNMFTAGNLKYGD